MPTHVRLLVVGSEQVRDGLADRLVRAVPRVRTDSADVATATDLLARPSNPFSAVVADLRGTGAGHDDPTRRERLGLDTVERLRDVVPELPLFVVTDAEREADLADLLAAGVTDTVRTCADGVPFDLLSARIAEELSPGSDPHAGEVLDDLHVTTRRLLRADDSESVARIVVETGDRVLGFAGVGIRFADEQREMLETVSVGGDAAVGIDERPPLPIDDTPHGRAYRTGETVLYDVTDDEYGLGAFAQTVYVPLGDHGVLSLARRAAGGIDLADLQYAEILAANATVALDRIEHERRHRRREAELRRRADRLDEFASFVSHDLRNPLNVALGRVELALEDDDTGHLPDARTALIRIERLIDDMLTLARDGTTVETTERLGLSAAVEHAWQGQYAGESAELRCSIPPSVTLSGDPERVHQLLSNLLGNVVDHAGDSVTAEVGLREDGEGFYVADDGPGIPPDERELVVKKGYTNSETGTGLGLAIVSEIADAHGWDLTVGESAAGGGRFDLTGVALDRE
jgi:signal transduction histidine kinase